MKIQTYIYYALLGVLTYLTVVEHNMIATVFIRLFIVLHLFLMGFYLSKESENAITVSYGNGYYRGVHMSLIFVSLISSVLLFNGYIVSGTVFLISEIFSYARITEVINDIKKKKVCD